MGVKRGLRIPKCRDLLQFPENRRGSRAGQRRENITDVTSLPRDPPSGAQGPTCLSGQRRGLGPGLLLLPEEESLRFTGTPVTRNWASSGALG